MKIVLEISGNVTPKKYTDFCIYVVVADVFLLVLLFI